MKAVSGSSSTSSRLALFGVVLLVGLIGFRLALLYWGLLMHDVLIPPGDDPAVHLQIMQQLAAGTFSLGSYPVGYHLLMQQLVAVTGLAPLVVVTLVGPLLVAGAVLSGYFLARTVLGWTGAIATAALLALVAAGPILGFIDGNYPGLLAGSFLLPIGFLFLLKALRSSPVRYAVTASLVFLAIAATHHLTYGILVLVVPTFFLALYLLERTGVLRLPHRTRVTMIVLFGLGVTVLVAWRSAGSGVFQLVIRDLVQGEAAGFLAGLNQAPVSLAQYSEVLGGAVWFGGLFGLAWFLTRQTIPLEQRLFIALWLGIVFLLSRLPQAGLPARFARELTIPLALVAGSLIAGMVAQVPVRAGRLALAGAIGIVLTASTAMLAQGPAQLPDGLDRMLWFNASDREKLMVLQALPVGSRILATPSSRYYEVLLEGRTLKAFPADVLDDPARIAQTIMEQADYLFIAGLPDSNPAIRTYPYFASYDAVRTTLERYDRVRTVHVFEDGSQIRRVVPAGPAVN